MGGFTSKAPVDTRKEETETPKDQAPNESGDLKEEFAQLEAKIKAKPSALRFCNQVLQGLEGKEGNDTIRKNIDKVLTCYNEFRQLCTPQTPRSIDDLINRAVDSLNLAGSKEEPEAVAGHIYVFNFPKLDEFPDIPADKQIKTLILKSNNLLRIPESSIAKLGSLETLDVSDNRFEQLPEELGTLSNLQSFIANENNIAALPEAFGDLSELRTLILFKNRLSKLPETFGQCKKLEEINLFNNSLGKANNFFSNFEDLKELNLGGNKLKTVPSTEKWAKLERLVLSWNNIVILQEFKGMKNLTTLQLNRNQLSEFPEDALVDSPLLEILDLSSNRLEKLPKSVSTMAHLVNLNVSSNQLSELCDLSGTTALKILNAGTNKFTEIDSSKIYECKSLATLLINDNQLKCLPSELEQLECLQRCNIKGNPDIELSEDLRSKLEAKCNENKGRWIC